MELIAVLRASDQYRDATRATVHLARNMQRNEQHSCCRREIMNIVTRLALIEQLLEDVATESSDQAEAPQLRQPAGEGRRLVTDLDQAQMLKAASYLRPSRHAGA